MATEIQSELEKFKIIYYEIIAGASYIPSENIYVKHFTELDNIEISKAKQYFLQRYRDEGIPFYQERYDVLVKNDEWHKEDDDKIDFIKTVIVDNEKNIKNVIKEQRPMIEAIIEEKKVELATALFKNR